MPLNFTRLQSEVSVTRDIRVLGGMAAFIFAMAIPFLYFGLSFYSQHRSLAIETIYLAEDIERIVQDRPEMWEYESERLRGLISQPAIDGNQDERTIRSAGGSVVVKNDFAVQRPAISSSAVFFDSGNPAGIIETRHSIRKQVIVTFFLGIVSVTFGYLLFFIFRTYPVRRLDNALTDLRQAEERIREYSENLQRMVEDRTGELNRALSDSREARDRIDGILKSVADGLIVTDLHNRVILMNRAAEDLLGVRMSDVIDRSIDQAIGDETLRERIRTTLEKKEQGYRFDFEMPGDNEGHPRIMRARTSVVEDKDGRHTGIITIINDVTHERELDRMKTDFITTAAHELRTPLTSIQGFSELLMSRNDISENEGKRFLYHINRQAMNLAAIITDLLDISRIESGKGFDLKKVPSDIVTIIQDAALHSDVSSVLHRFDMTFPEETAKIIIDPEKMEQVFTNIFSNAVKYSPRGGIIRVTGTVMGDQYQVSVEDEGMGMTPEQVEKIFDKFYRADSSTTACGGTGLGMSIVKYIVDAHGGTVWVESMIGKGTTVRVTVPTKVG